MRKLIFLWILIIIYWPLNAQNEHKLRIPSIVSPQTYQMLKYTETPVSYASGLPQISIPLYSYKEGGVSLNLSLSYHAKGIKVNEIAAPFGLGWNLNGIGEITRTVRGLRDETGTNGYIYTDKKASEASQTTLQNSMNSYNGICTVDYEPDLYNIILPNGKNVQFMFAQNLPNNTNNIITYPLSDFKIISPYSQNVDYWQVIDTDGTVYYFGQNEAYDNSLRKIYDYNPNNGSIPIVGNDSEDFVITSWKLTKIKTINNEMIDFKYRDENFTAQNYCYNNSMSSSIPLTNLPQTNSYSLMGMEGKNSIIQSITSGDTKIDFSKGGLREDLKYSNIISAIDIYYNNVLQNEIKLNFSYFISTNDFIGMSYGCGGPIDINELRKRLKLDEVVFNDRSRNKINNYILQYNTSVNLPDRNSYAQDYWGYYNGKDNTGLIPEIILDPDYLGQYGAGISTPMKISGADRKIDSLYTQANILKKIIYPSKGYTDFEYENNAVLYDKDNTPVPMVNTAEKKGVFVSSRDYERKISDLTYIFTKKMIIGDKVIISKGLEYTSNAGNCQPNDASGPNIDCSKFNILNLDTNSYISSVDMSLGSNNINNPMILQKGNYEIHLKVKADEYDHYVNNNLPLPEWSVELSYYERKNVNNIQFGGLRIKEISTYESDNKLALKKKYSYTKFGDNKKSSGRYYSFPNHVEIKQGAIAPCHPGLHEVYLLNFSSSSYYPLIDIGNYVAYTDVEEEEINSLNNQTIYSRYNYNFVEPYFNFPNEPQTRQWETGNLTDYKSLHTSKSYLYYYHPTAKSIKGIDISSLNFYSIPFNGQCTDGKIYSTKSLNSAGGRYELFTNYYFLQREEITQDNVKIKNEYFYNNPSHYQLSRQKTTFSDGKINETAYTYAHEKGNQLMIDKNMVGIPLETSTTQTSGNVTQTLSKTETVYPKTAAEITNNTFSLVLPKSALSYDLQNPTVATTEVTYDKYDSKGNLQQYTGKNGVSTTIIWGYNQTQPIAKIEGAKLSDIPQSLIDAVVTASVNDAQQGTAASEQSLIDALDTFRNSIRLSAYQISTYTYDPLIGVKSITPPSGIREVYIYDTANRLEKVVDVNGKIIKEYKYNYKN